MQVKNARLQAGQLPVHRPQLSQLIQARRLRFSGYVTRTDTSLNITRALKSLKPRPAQGLEKSTRSSSSYLATHPGSRSPTS